MRHNKRNQQRVYTPPQVIGEKEVLLEQGLLTQSKSVTMHIDTFEQDVENLDFSSGESYLEDSYNYKWE